MNLIHVMTNYLVVPANDPSVVVGMSQFPQSIDLELRWESEGEIFSIETVDQEIEPLDQDSSTGMFTIIDNEGEGCMFIAYTEAKLK